MRRSWALAGALGLGTAPLATLLNQETSAAGPVVRGLPGLPHFAPKAKRVIYLFQSGAPSQLRR